MKKDISDTIALFFVCLFSGLGVSLLLFVVVAIAEPLINFTWDDPTTYNNGTLIPSGDLERRTLKCGDTAGGPYPAEVEFQSQTPPSLEDMAFLVGNQPGTYYCVTTVWSAQYGTESGPSNEANFTVGPVDTGHIPGPPRNFAIQ